MKSFMKMLLASFGIMSLVLAGCSSATDTTVEEDEDRVMEEDTVEEEVMEEVEETMEEAE